LDNYYNKESDRSIRFDDPEIEIDWGNENPILSEKDRNAPFLKDSDVNF
ncbi:dTDP-4-dehydrorhamnose 3,5-epimerase family protein, partial [Candidatus Nomurabacteria bacterium]|nr:dTDP-4-dehydrorhamnose 3,5-epimerase family protein [Candidatus Nomurabacteria bacterium]